MKNLIYTLLLCTLASSATGDYCPYKWEELGGNCLDISEMTGKPNEARSRCQNMGGYLAIIETPEQHSYLQNKMALGTMATTPIGCTNDNDYTWTCVGKSYEEWFWNDDTSNAGFWNWAPDEPTNDPGEISRAFLNVASNWTDDSKNETRNMMVACLHGKLQTEVICPIGWEIYDNKCIYLQPNYVGRPKHVRTFCETQGASMLTVDSFEENAYLTDRLQTRNNDYLVLGCNDQNIEGHWRCDDRLEPYMVHWYQNETESGFWNWGTDEPAYGDPEEDCAFLRSTGNWQALKCAQEYTMVLACEHAPSQVLCPTGFLPWEDRCLHLSYFLGTATGATQECKAIGGSLVILDNDAQNDFLQDQMNSTVHVMAMGCNDATEEGAWTCDNVDPKQVYWRDINDYGGYWKWNVKGNEPDDTNNQDCMYMYHKAGTWRSESCDAVFEMLLACFTYPFLTVDETKQQHEEFKVDETKQQHEEEANYPEDIIGNPQLAFDDIPMSVFVLSENNAQPVSSAAVTAVIFGVVAMIAVVAWIGYAYKRPASKSGVFIRKWKPNAPGPHLIET